MNNHRIHALDMLRAVAMYLGVVLHAAIVYQNYPRPGWPQDDFSSQWFDFYYLTIHSFRMQLFFLIAGYFAHLLVDRIGKRKFIFHRLKRIVIPFVVSILLITPLSALAFNYYKVLQSGEVVADVWQSALHMSLGWNGLFHLWFLYYLIIFYALTLIFQEVAKKLAINLIYTVSTIGYRFFETLLYTIILSTLVYFTYGTSIEPWTGLKPLLSQMLYYGLFYLLGSIIYHQRSIELGKNNCWYYLVLGSMLSALLFLHTLNSFIPEYFVILMMSCQTIFLVFGTLGFFLKYLEIDAAWVRYLSDSSYWVYLVHFPIVTVGQALLLNVHGLGLFKFLIVLFVASSISFITYKIFVRNTVIGFALNGSRAN